MIYRSLARHTIPGGANNDRYHNFFDVPLDEDFEQPYSC